MAVTVKLTGKRTNHVLADRRPRLTVQVDICGQLALDRRIVGAGINALGKPCQLRAGADEINVILLHGFRGAAAVPGNCRILRYGSDGLRHSKIFFVFYSAFRICLLCGILLGVVNRVFVLRLLV